MSIGFPPHILTILSIISPPCYLFHLHFSPIFLRQLLPHSTFHLPLSHILRLLSPRHTPDVSLPSLTPLRFTYLPATPLHWILQRFTCLQPRQKYHFSHILSFSFSSSLLSFLPSLILSSLFFSTYHTTMSGTLESSHILKPIK